MSERLLSLRDWDASAQVDPQVLPGLFIVQNEAV